MHTLLNISDAFAWRIGSNPYLQRLYQYLAFEAHGFVRCVLVLPAIVGGLFIAVGGLVTTFVNTLAGTNPHPLSYESFGKTHIEHPLGVIAGTAAVVLLSRLVPDGSVMLALCGYAAFALWLIQAMNEYGPAPVQARI